MKTSGFHAAKGQPGCISIARRAPRGFTHLPSYMALAPGSWFMSVSKEVYFERFCNEVLARLKALDTWHELYMLVNPGLDRDAAHAVLQAERQGLAIPAEVVEPILCCWERPPLTEANWCHRTIVADWFELELGPRPSELEPCRHPRSRK